MTEEIEKQKREIAKLKSLIEIADKCIPKNGSWWRKWQKAKKDLHVVQ